MINKDNINWKVCIPTADDIKRHECIHKDVYDTSDSRVICLDCGAELLNEDSDTTNMAINVGAQSDSIIKYIESIKATIPVNEDTEKIISGLAVTISWLEKMPTISDFVLAYNDNDISTIAAKKISDAVLGSAQKIVKKIEGTN